MTITPGIQCLANDIGFFDYSQTHTDQSRYDNLYEIVKKESQFKFNADKGYCIGFRYVYPINAVTQSNLQSILN